MKEEYPDTNKIYKKDKDMKEIVPANVRSAIEDMMDDIEAMFGCCDETDDNSPNWDEYMQARIRVIRKFLKSN